MTANSGLNLLTVIMYRSSPDLCGIVRYPSFGYLGWHCKLYHIYSSDDNSAKQYNTSYPTSRSVHSCPQSQISTGPAEYLIVISGSGMQKSETLGNSGSDRHQYVVIRINFLKY